MNDDIRSFIEKEKIDLAGDFCRGCGYCMPCPAGIMINQCARMSLMLRRAPSQNWLTEEMQEEMRKIENCLHCGQCSKNVPTNWIRRHCLKKIMRIIKKSLPERWKFNFRIHLQIVSAD